MVGDSGPAGVRRGSVRLAHTVVPLARLRSSPGEHAGLFEQARSQAGSAQCLCRSPAPRLVIRRTRGGRYHLAGWPGQGDQHAPGCDFYKSPTEESAQGWAAGSRSLSAVHVNEDGLDIALRPALLVTAPKSRSVSDTRRETSAVSRRGLTLLALLEVLWEAARLHTWQPGARRSWEHCRARLVEEAHRCQVNGQPLGEALYVVPPWRNQDAEQLRQGFDRFTERLSPADGELRRGLILGEIRGLEPSQYGFRLTLRNLGPSLFSAPAVVEKLRRSFRVVLSQVRPAGSRQIGLFLVERTDRGTLRVADAGLMLGSQIWLPCDSSYEVTMADALVRARRHVVKPMTYDQMDKVFPDFVLVDTDPATVVEVYGMTHDPVYAARQRAKERHYEAEGIPLISWEVTGPLPSIDLGGSKRATAVGPRGSDGGASGDA